MNNYLTIKETNNGFVVELNNYSSKPCCQGTWVARSIEELNTVLEKNVYPAFNESIDKKQ